MKTQTSGKGTKPPVEKKATPSVWKVFRGTGYQARFDDVAQAEIHTSSCVDPSGVASVLYTPQVAVASLYGNGRTNRTGESTTDFNEASQWCKDTITLLLHQPLLEFTQGNWSQVDPTRCPADDKV